MKLRRLIFVMIAALTMASSASLSGKAVARTRAEVSAVFTEAENASSACNSKWIVYLPDLVNPFGTLETSDICDLLEILDLAPDKSALAVSPELTAKSTPEHFAIWYKESSTGINCSHNVSPASTEAQAAAEPLTQTPAPTEAPIYAFLQQQPPAKTKTGSTSQAPTSKAIIEHFAIWYKVDSIDINRNYLDNKRQMEHIIHYLDKSPRIDSITIYAWASPEGRYSWNKWLSQERAKTAKAFLLKHSKDSLRLNAGKIRISPIAENWQGLTRLVEENYTRDDREKVLSILHDTAISDQVRKIRLQKLDGGRSWRYLIDNYMPGLRTATWVCVWVEAPPILPNPGIRGDVLRYDSGGIRTGLPAMQERPQMKEKKMIMAARSNLLVPGLNVGLEFPIKNNWSMGIDYYYPWAVSKKNKWCGEMLGLFVDAKYWFPGNRYQWTKADRLQGHALGLYAGAGYYDYQNIRHGYQGEYIDAGFDYTFGLPVGPKDNRWMRIEFNVGLGWIRTWARHYAPSDDYTQLIKDSGVKNLIFDYFGPTRTSISFLLPISATYKVKGGGR